MKARISEIKLKSETAIESGLHPIICVGENAEDYKGMTFIR